MSCISFVQFVLGPGSRKSWRVSSSTERGKAEGGGFWTFWTCSCLWLARSVSYLSIEDLVAILCYSWKIWSCTILVPGTQFVFGLVIWRWFGGVYIISEHPTSLLRCRLFADVFFLPLISHHNHHLPDTFCKLYFFYTYRHTGSIQSILRNCT